MKKFAILLLSVLLTLSLCACSESTKVIAVDNYTFTVDPQNGNIYDGTHSYKYTFSGDSTSYEIDITYPNGSTYFWNQSEHLGSGGWSDDYKENLYVSPEILCGVILETIPESTSPLKVFVIILLLAMGVFNLVSPQTSWCLNDGWKYKNAEPSDFALGLYQIAGVIAIIIAIVLIFI